MKILFVSLGCDKNLADTESMLGLLLCANLSAYPCCGACACITAPLIPPPDDPLFSDSVLAGLVSASGFLPCMACITADICAICAFICCTTCISVCPWDTCSFIFSIPSKSIISRAINDSCAFSGAKKPMLYNSFARSFCSIRENGFFFCARISMSNTGRLYSSS